MRAVRCVTVLGVVIGLFVGMCGCGKREDAAENKPQKEDRQASSPQQVSASQEEAIQKSPESQNLVEAVKKGDVSDTRLFLADESTSGHLAAADTPKDEVIKKELAQLQGVWAVVSVEIAGAPQEALETMKSVTIAFEKSKVTVKAQREGKEQVFRESACSLDPTKSPKEITFASTEANNATPATPATPGIYHMDGDSLKLCLAEVRGEVRRDPETGKAAEEKITVGKRPTAFDPKEGILFVLNRKKR